MAPARQRLALPGRWLHLGAAGFGRHTLYGAPIVRLQPSHRPGGDDGHRSIEARITDPHPFGDPQQQGFHAIQAGFNGG
jgi:hypothetical protein